MKKILIGFIFFILLLSVSCNSKLGEIEKSDLSDTDEKVENEDKKSQASYKDALSDEELNQAKELAVDYYKKTVWELISIDVVNDEYPLYNNEGIEADYKAGEIIIFHVVAKKDNEVFNLIISVAKVNGEWKIINNGYKLY